MSMNFRRCPFGNLVTAIHRRNSAGSVFQELYFNGLAEFKQVSISTIEMVLLLVTRICGTYPNVAAALLECFAEHQNIAAPSDY